MNKIEKLLIFRKTTKLDYLIDKYGLSQVKSSPEYSKLLISKDIQDKNTNDFVEAMLKFANSNQTIKIITDSFHKNDILSKEINSETYNKVYSLGGDGTFLRSTTLVKTGNPVFIGVNTDQKRSTGHYCSLQINNHLEETVKKLLNKEFKEKLINKIQVKNLTTAEVFYFINDLYFSEQFKGRISNYELFFNKKDVNLSLRQQLGLSASEDLIENQFKSSGIIFSTYDGFSGWIRNSNNISLSKYENNSNGIKELSLESKLRSYLDFNSNNSYLYNDENKNKLFYFISQPTIYKPKKEISNEEAYLKYKLLEGCVDTIKLKSYCYEGDLIIDGSFEKTLNYGDEIVLSVSNNKLRTIEKL